MRKLILLSTLFQLVLPTPGFMKPYNLPKPDYTTPPRPYPNWRNNNPLPLPPTILFDTETNKFRIITCSGGFCVEQ